MGSHFQGGNGHPSRSPAISVAEVAGDERAIPRVGQIVVHPQIFEPLMVTHPTLMDGIQASGFDPCEMSG